MENILNVALKGGCFPKDSYNITSVSYEEIYRFKLYRNLSFIRNIKLRYKKWQDYLLCNFASALLHNSVKILPWN